MNGRNDEKDDAITTSNNTVGSCSSCGRQNGCGMRLKESMTTPTSRRTRSFSSFYLFHALLLSINLDRGAIRRCTGGLQPERRASLPPCSPCTACS